MGLFRKSPAAAESRGDAVVFSATTSDAPLIKKGGSSAVKLFVSPQGVRVTNAAEAHTLASLGFDELHSWAVCGKKISVRFNDQSSGFGNTTSSLRAGGVGSYVFELSNAAALSSKLTEFARNITAQKKAQEEEDERLAAQEAEIKALALAAQALAAAPAAPAPAPLAPVATTSAAPRPGPQLSPLAAATPTTPSGTFSAFSALPLADGGAPPPPPAAAPPAAPAEPSTDGWGEDAPASLAQLLS